MKYMCGCLIRTRHVGVIGIMTCQIQKRRHEAEQKALLQKTKQGFKEVGIILRESSKAKGEKKKKKV